MPEEKTEKKYKNAIKRRMRSIGTYRSEFLPIIERLAMLYCHRDKLEQQYAASGSEPVIMHTNKSGVTNPTKNPILTARDEVYSQILSHERELGLTPNAMKKLNGTAFRSADGTGGKAGGLRGAMQKAMTGAGG